MYGISSPTQDSGTSELYGHFNCLCKNVGTFPRTRGLRFILRCGWNVEIWSRFEKLPSGVFFQPLSRVEFHKGNSQLTPWNHMMAGGLQAHTWSVLFLFFKQQQQRQHLHKSHKMHIKSIKSLSVFITVLNELFKLFVKLLFGNSEPCVELHQEVVRASCFGHNDPGVNQWWISIGHC